MAFWIKLSDSVQGSVLTTEKGISEGTMIHIDGSGKFVYDVKLKGSGMNTFSGFSWNADFKIGSWLHITFVFHSDLELVKVYHDGSEAAMNYFAPQSLSVEDTEGRMILGRKSVDVNDNEEPRNMILDEIIFCNKPLNQNEIPGVM